jgi:hypothetical protein
MRLPVVVLTTLYEPFSTILLLHESTITGETRTRYENVYVVSYFMSRRLGHSYVARSSIAFSYSA